MAPHDLDAAELVHVDGDVVLRADGGRAEILLRAPAVAVAAHPRQQPPVAGVGDDGPVGADGHGNRIGTTGSRQRHGRGELSAAPARRYAHLATVARRALDPRRRAVAEGVEGELRQEADVAADDAARRPHRRRRAECDPDVAGVRRQRDEACLAVAVEVDEARRQRMLGAVGAAGVANREACAARRVLAEPVLERPRGDLGARAGRQGPEAHHERVRLGDRDRRGEGAERRTRPDQGRGEENSCGAKDSAHG